MGVCGEREGPSQAEHLLAAALGGDLAVSFFDLDAGLSTLDGASIEMARLLAWSEERRLSEVTACRHRHEENNALFDNARKKAREKAQKKAREKESI